jgi:hypothetical protein
MVGEDESMNIELEGVAHRPAVAHRHFVLAVLRRDRLVLHLRPIDVAHRRHSSVHDVVEARAYGVGNRLLSDNLHRMLPQLKFRPNHSCFLQTGATSIRARRNGLFCLEFATGGAA